MELREFIKKVIADAVQAVDESSRIASRTITLTSKGDKRTIEFDVAVSAEETNRKGGKGGVKVLAVFEARGGISHESRNSTVSRITFGVDVDSSTKVERQMTALNAASRDRRNPAV